MKYVFVLLAVILCSKLFLYSYDIVSPVIDMSKEECLLEISEKNELQKKTSDLVLKSTYINQIGNIYYHLEDYKNAIHYYVMTKYTDDNTILLIAQSYEKLNDIKTAVFYYKKIDENSDSYLSVTQKLLDISYTEPNIVNSKVILNTLLNQKNDDSNVTLVFANANKEINKDNPKQQKEIYEEWLNKHSKNEYNSVVAALLYQMIYEAGKEETKLLSKYVNKYYRNNIHGYKLLYLLGCGYLNEKDYFSASNVFQKIINDSKKSKYSDEELRHNIESVYNMLIISYSLSKNDRMANKIQKEFKNRFPESYEKYYTDNEKKDNFFANLGIKNIVLIMSILAVIFIITYKLRVLTR